MWISLVDAMSLKTLRIESINGQGVAPDYECRLMSWTLCDLFLDRIMGKPGLCVIEGYSGEQSITVLTNVLAFLSHNDISGVDQVIQRETRNLLRDLRVLACLRPEGVWKAG